LGEIFNAFGLRYDINYRRAACETYCRVFTPRRNCNFETRSRDYATVDKAVFSSCRAEPCRVAPRTLLRSAEVNMFPLLGDKCKRLDCARVGERSRDLRGSAMTSRNSRSTVGSCVLPRVQSRVYRRD
jgi:hypothetical protein